MTIHADGPTSPTERWACTNGNPQENLTLRHTNMQVDRGMSGNRSGSNMWMKGPSFLFCSLYYASGAKGKRRLSIASQSKGIKQNVSSVEACRGPKSQTKIASEGDPLSQQCVCACACACGCVGVWGWGGGCVCVCVRLLHPHQPCPRQALKTTTSKTAHLAPNQTARLPSALMAKSVPFADFGLLCMYCHFGYKSKEYCIRQFKQRYGFRIVLIEWLTRKILHLDRSLLNFCHSVFKE